MMFDILVYSSLLKWMIKMNALYCKTLCTILCLDTEYFSKCCRSTEYSMHKEHLHTVYIIHSACWYAILGSLQKKNPTHVISSNTLIFSQPSGGSRLNMQLLLGFGDEVNLGRGELLPLSAGRNYKSQMILWIIIRAENLSNSHDIIKQTIKYNMNLIQLLDQQSGLITSLQV